jgi:hypothetical protein
VAGGRHFWKDEFLWNTLLFMGLTMILEARFGREGVSARWR